MTTFGKAIASDADDVANEGSRPVTIQKITSRAATVEAAFMNAAEELFACAHQPAAGAPRHILPISFVEYGNETVALEKWLHLLLKLSEEHQIAISECHLQRRGTYWWGYAKGSPRTVPRIRVRPRLGQRDMAVRRTGRLWAVAFTVDSDGSAEAKRAAA